MGGCRWLGELSGNKAHSACNLVEIEVEVEICKNGAKKNNVIILMQYITKLFKTGIC